MEIYDKCLEKDIDIEKDSEKPKPLTFLYGRIWFDRDYPWVWNKIKL